jgi:hypothetical protein
MKTARIYSESNNASLVGVLTHLLYIFDLALLRFGKRYSFSQKQYLSSHVPSPLPKE